MTIDIHALLEKNPITRNMVKPKFGYKYLGAYNPLDNQLLYDKQTGDIYTYYDKPKNVLDKIASRHDTCYSVGKNKNYCDRIMVDEINNIPYNERPWGTFAIKQIIDKKQKLGLGEENHNKILSETLHKAKRKNYPRRRISVNHIDEIFSADLVEMQKFAKVNKGYRYLLTCIDIFSKYSWVIPLKDKKGNTIKNALQRIFKQRKPNLLWTDRGTEFYNKQVQDLLNENNIKLYSTNNSEIKSAVVV